MPSGYANCQLTDVPRMIARIGLTGELYYPEHRFTEPIIPNGQLLRIHQHPDVCVIAVFTFIEGCSSSPIRKIAICQSILDNILILDEIAQFLR